MLEKESQASLGNSSCEDRVHVYFSPSDTENLVPLTCIYARPRHNSEQRQKHKIMKTKITFLGLMLAALFITSCDNDAIDANGSIINEERELTGYTSISLSVPAKVFITDEPGETFRIKTHENLLRVIDTDVIGSTLRITTNNNLRKVKTLEVYVSALDYEKLSITGAGSITVERCLDLDQLSLEITGAGLINVCGTAEELTTKITGAGKIEAYDLETLSTTVNVSGSGEIQTSVSESLDVDISGAGVVKYIANPEITSRISGAGVIRKTN